jgi:hypothetical protein
MIYGNGSDVIDTTTQATSRDTYGHYWKLNTTNATNTTAQSSTDSDSDTQSDWVLTLLLTCPAGALIVLSNCVVLAVGLRSKYLRHNSHYCVVLCLAVNDVMVGVSMISRGIITVLPDSLYTTHSTCLVIYLSMIICFSTSLLQTALICLERFLAVFRPSLMPCMFGGWRKYGLGLLAWMISLTYYGIIGGTLAVPGEYDACVLEVVFGDNYHTLEVLVVIFMVTIYIVTVVVYLITVVKLQSQNSESGISEEQQLTTGTRGLQTSKYSKRLKRINKSQARRIEHGLVHVLYGIPGLPSSEESVQSSVPVNSLQRRILSSEESVQSSVPVNSLQRRIHSSEESVQSSVPVIDVGHSDDIGVGHHYVIGVGHCDVIGIGHCDVIDVGHSDVICVGHSDVINVGQCDVINVGQCGVIDVGHNDVIDVGHNGIIGVGHIDVIGVGHSGVIGVGHSAVIGVEHSDISDIAQSDVIDVVATKPRRSRRYRSWQVSASVTVGVLLLVLSVCLLPFIVALVTELICGEHVVTQNSRRIVTYLACLNSCANPLIYTWRLSEFQKQLKQMCCRERTAAIRVQLKCTG